MVDFRGVVVISIPRLYSNRWTIPDLPLMIITYPLFSRAIWEIKVSNFVCDN